MKLFNVFLALLLAVPAAQGAQIGSAYEVYRMPSSGTIPSFGAIDLSQSAATANQLPVAKGGTGAATLTSNGVLLGNGTSAVSATSAGSAYNLFRVGSGGGAPAFGTFDLSQSGAVGSSVLGVTNGGTGVTTSTGTGNTVRSSAPTLTSPVIATGMTLWTGAGGLVSNGSGAVSVAPSRTRQVFTSGSGTYTLPAGAKYITVRIVAGGGSGGGGGGASPGSEGSTGTTTSFGAGPLHSCTGGAGGAVSNGTPAAGGTCTIGAGGTGWTIPGGIGGGVSSGNAETFTAGGTGGGTCMGGGAGTGNAATGGNAGAINSGGGGSGGGGSNNATNGGGNGGGGGGCADFVIGAPSATYAYAVGGTTAGGAGSTGGTGGVGAAGIIIVDEFYQ